MIRRFRDQYLATREQQWILAAVFAAEVALLALARLVGRRLKEE